MDSETQNFADIDLKELISTYTKHWKWFVLCCILTLSLAYVYLRYATPEYAAKAKIQIIEEKNGASELSAFNDLDILGGGKNKVADEIEILNSRSNFIEVAKNLKLNLKLTALGNVKNTEIYNNRPISINFIASDSILYNSSGTFYIEIISDTQFGYAKEEDEPFKMYAYGKSVKTDLKDVIITPNNPYFKKYKGRKLKISVSPIYRVAQGYQSKLNVEVPDDLANIINVTLKDPVQQKAIDIIDNLVSTYNRNAVEDKKKVADKTEQFINERITNISSSLTDVDQNAQELLTERGMTGSGMEVGAAVQVSAASRQNLDQAKNTLASVSNFKEYVASGDGYEIMPVVDLGNAAVASNLANYNKLVSERDRMLKSADERNPIVQSLTQELDQLKSSLKSSLSTMEQNVGMSVSTLQTQMNRIQGTIYQAPKNQQALTNITRQQQTTANLYLYLLQKREEAQIAAASSPEKSKVIDYAYLQSRLPVSPKNKTVYLAALIMGLLLPFSIIYANDLLDNKIHNKTGLEKIAKNIPVLAELPKLGKKDELLVHKEDRSVLGESLRILRTNLDYLINTRSTEKNNIIFVTSSVPGEGKTFLSSNLTMIFGNTDKKVLLIGADIRNPKLYTFFTSKELNKMGVKPTRSKDAGLTEFLYDKNLSVKDITNTLEIKNNTIDVIYSGKIPPNPTELLMSDKLNGLFEEVSKEYDYVVVDTAPLMVVTDTLLISKYANHVLYVTRAGITENRVVDFPVKLQQEGKLNGLAFVVNDVKEANLGYGGKYGYGYGKSTKKWWKIWG